MPGSEFDNHLKELLENRQFEPDDALWKDIRGNIEIKDRQKKRRMIIGFSSVIILLGFLFFNIQKSSVSDSEPKHNKNAILLSEETGAIKKTNKQNSPSENQSEKNLLPIKKNTHASQSGNEKSLLVMEPKSQTDPDKTAENIIPSEIQFKPDRPKDSKTNSSQMILKPILTEATEFKEETSAKSAKLFENDRFGKDSTIRTCNTIDTVLLNKALARDQNRKHIFFGFKFGAIGFENFKSSLTTSSKYAISPSIGLCIGLRNLKYQLSFEPEFFKRNNINTEKDYQVNDFGFGISNKKNIVTALSAQIIHLPLFFGYKIHSKHMLKLGIYSNILIGGSSKVSFKTSNELSRNESSQKQNGLPNGLNNFDFGLTAAGQFRISNSSSLELKIIYGFLDQTRNTYYQNNVLDKNHGIQLNYILQLY